MTDQGRACRVLVMSTLAFTICFAAWMINGVLVTFLVEQKIRSWTPLQIGWLVGAPVLTGAAMRLPLGLLADRYGGRAVLTGLMLTAAVPMFFLSYAESYQHFLLAGLGFGLAGASFAVGVAYISVWFPKKHIGTALGIFGLGNVGAAATAMFAPLLLQRLTATDPDHWRALPQMYAWMLVAMAGLFWLFTFTKKVEGNGDASLLQRLHPLRQLRVWRFGLYYSFFFGGFVALSQWLIPYYVNVYTMPVATAGFLTALFSLPSGFVRMFGGWISDQWGARTVMYGTLVAGLLGCVFLFPAAMVIHTPGEGITAAGDAVVARVTAREIALSNGKIYALQEKDPGKLLDFTHDRHLVWPKTARWQEPLVKEGEAVHKGQLLARGTTRVFFQANQWVFTFWVFVLGCAMGIGMAAVYKHIPTYFPGEVGVVGGLVGVLGGLGGFAFPIVFGLLLKGTGLWTTCWVFLALLAGVCLAWMHLVIRRMMREQLPDLVRRVEGLKP